MGLMLVIVAFVTGLLTDDEHGVNEEMYQQAPVSLQIPPPSSFKSDATLDLDYGDNSKRVLEVLGKPTHVADGSWFYGLLQVYFGQGRVIGWHSNQGSLSA